MEQDGGHCGLLVKSTCRRNTHFNESEDWKIPGRVDMDSDGSGCEVIFLNRVLRIVRSGNRPSFEIEGDPRHVGIVVSELGLASEKTKTMDTLENREGEADCLLHCCCLVRMTRTWTF